MIPCPNAYKPIPVRETGETERACNKNFAMIELAIDQLRLCMAGKFASLPIGISTPGSAGDTGPQGEPGESADGLPGSDGSDGTAGETGIDGLPGSDGEPGSAGDTGPQGEPGVDGAAGATGATGAAGSNGANGRTVMTMSGYFSGNDADSMYLSPASADANLNGDPLPFGVAFNATTARLLVWVLQADDSFTFKLTDESGTDIIASWINVAASFTGAKDSGASAVTLGLGDHIDVGLTSSTQTGTLRFAWVLYLYD